MARNEQFNIADLIAARLSRRQVLQYGVGSLFAAMLPLSGCQQPSGTGLLGFEAIAAADLIDSVVVPQGYSAQVFYAWGDPISEGPAFKMDGSNTAEEQLLQAGMHHDALQFFPLPKGSENSQHGLLVMNHEYIDAQVLHADGGVFDAPDSYTAEKTLKEQHAHGISLIEVHQQQGRWHIVRPSQYARRITARTPMSLSGPVAGSDFIKTELDALGQEILGTFNNCANGKTPWGTTLSCEENFNDYFQLTDADDASERQQAAWQRYDIKRSYYGWHEHDARFNVDFHPNEPNRFGWVIEFDPYDPQSRPIKRSALGRFSHENVAHKIAKDGRVAFYSGDDSRFEYVYKFITQDAWDGSQGAKHGRLLDEGVLHVARFNDDGSGRWLPLIFGQGGLTPQNGFDSQAEVLVHARLAADAVGATPMDRPEWVATHPETGDVYVSMTNNAKRGDDGVASSDGANPRDNNLFGHIVKLIEADASATQFDWDVFALAGSEDQGGSIQGDVYANPDGMMIDARGVLWVQTDISAKKLNTDEFAQFGNNQMLAVDPETGETRRFLTGPVGCEVTGVAMTPDLTTMWVNIQHPGDVPTIMAKQGIKKSPSQPNAASNWPDHATNGRPRSATVLITKEDGGIIGS